MAHKDIRIKFKLGDRNYEAVGFLVEGEPSIDGDSMLQRTARENGGAIGDEDEAYLYEHRAELPSELKSYWLATNRRNSDYPRAVCCLISCYGERHRNGQWLDKEFYHFCLVVRRLS